MRKLLLFITSIVVVCLISDSVSLQALQGKHLEPEEIATPVEDGVLTAQQKEHSKLYEKYQSNRKIRDSILVNSAAFSSFRTACPFISQKPLPSIVSELADAADAVVIASFVSKSSQLTTNGSYIFTDYELRTEEVLKNRGAGALKPETVITVSRPGGKVLLYGHTATYSELAFKSLLPGHRYLLFLKHIPATGAYRPVSHEASFDITNTTVETLTEGSARAFEKELSAFITSVKGAIGNPQKKGRAQ
jgi:hypothetical protein